MNVILLTILLTVLGMCLVVYFTWLGITSYKLMKFKTKTEGAIMHTERWINDNHESVCKEMEIIRNDLAKIIDENNNAIHQRLTNEVTELINSIDQLDRKIDSRVDKLNEKVECNYNLLKETQKNVEKVSSESNMVYKTGCGEKTWTVK